MKTIVSSLTALAVFGSSLMASSVATAEMSYNVGYVSEYYYRGFLQKNSSASAGADYESGGFYAGVWSADVGEGLEVDGYFGYGADIGDLSVSVGFTGYYYTGSFDDTYEEINTNFGYGPVSLEYSAGSYDGSFCEDTICQDYSFTALSADLGSGFAATYGSFGQDAAGAYFELGYGTTVSDIDIGVSVIFPDDDIATEDGEALVLSIGKSF